MEIDRRTARRLAVQGQRLAGPRPASIAETVHDLWMVQIDPTRVVARTEHLVLFSRLGRRFRVEELDRMLWRERSLFEYWVHIVPTSDLWMHRLSMRRYPTGGPRGSLASRQRVDAWLKANVAFRRYILRELEARGPLRARDLEDRVADGWHAGGWSGEGRNVSEMLDVLWSKGEIMIVGRDGQQRVWDLASRSLPMDGPRPPARAIAREVVERQLRARGVAPVEVLGSLFDGRPPGWRTAVRELVREGAAVPVSIEGVAGDAWYAHAEVIERPWKPRTVALSPFDDLVSDRDRTEALFDFHFRLEIYVPKGKRRWGYFVLPILHGDRLIGRVDPRFDRRTSTLHLNAVYAEAGTTARDGAAAGRAVRELAGWLGACAISLDGAVPSGWRRSLGL
ncbi:MAG: winged helix-turn-helix domain-containing protein [Actinomycetota bacterium]